MKRIALFAVLALAGVALFTPWLFGEARGKQTASRLEAPYPLTFPDDFAWGVAVAAQHVEHQQPSDWTAFERRVIREAVCLPRASPNSQGVNSATNTRSEVAPKTMTAVRFITALQVARISETIFSGRHKPPTTERARAVTATNPQRRGSPLCHCRRLQSLRPRTR